MALQSTYSLHLAKLAKRRLRCGHDGFRVSFGLGDTKTGMSRFIETGKLDTTFNAIVESSDPNHTTSVAEAAALQANGQIVVGGLINQERANCRRRVYGLTAMVSWHRRVVWRLLLSDE